MPWEFLDANHRTKAWPHDFIHLKTNPLHPVSTPPRECTGEAMLDKLTVVRRNPSLWKRHDGVFSATGAITC